MPVSKAMVLFPSPVEQVWHTVTDLTHTAWRSDLARVETLDENRFIEHSKSGYATFFTVTACEPLCLWAFVMENGFSKRWKAAPGLSAPRPSSPNAGGCVPLCPAI